ncbi:MAG TPA: hypothetical protein VFC24_13875 [Casimicrobiaceae bacterium]|nr:hypothetical protein [Casimicrobiaceae bacterium]
MPDHTSALTRLLQGVAVGAVAMYMLDPDRGRRRRAITRDKVQRFANDTVRLANQATRDTRQRLHGLNARLQQRMTRRDDESVDELRLIERVRSAMGRCVSHPHAIQVGANGTTVVVSGPILRHELPELLATVRAIPGVTGVDNHLDVHDAGDRVPSLQGEGRARLRNAGPQAWTPTMRLAALVGGGVLALYGLAKRNTSGLLLASAGLGVAARVVTNEPLERWLVDTAQELISGQLGAGREEHGMAPGIGADGTPTRATLSPEVSAPRHDDRTSGASDTPLLGADGTPSTAGAQRLVMSDEEAGTAPSQEIPRSVH